MPPGGLSSRMLRNSTSPTEASTPGPPTGTAGCSSPPQPASTAGTASRAPNTAPAQRRGVPAAPTPGVLARRPRTAPVTSVHLSTVGCGRHGVTPAGGTDTGPGWTPRSPAWASRRSTRWCRDRAASPGPDVGFTPLALSTSPGGRSCDRRWTCQARRTAAQRSRGGGDAARHREQGRPSPDRGVGAGAPAGDPGRRAGDVVPGDARRRPSGSAGPSPGRPGACSWTSPRRTGPAGPCPSPARLDERSGGDRCCTPTALLYSRERRAGPHGRPASGLRPLDPQSHSRDSPGFAKVL